MDEDREMTDRLVYRIPEVCKMLNISRATFYRMVHTRAIVVHKLGSSTFVKHESLARAIDAMTEFTPRPDPQLDTGCSKTERDSAKLVGTGKRRGRWSK